MRTYDKTHPWLTYIANLQSASTRLWTILGQCQSKCEHIAKAPILPEVQTELLQVYLAKGSRATTAIEGNTLSEEEVRRHLRGELKLPPSKEYLAREIDNIVSACNAILSTIRDGYPVPSLDVKEIEQINGAVLEGLDVDDHVEPGKIRRVSVDVPGYRGAPPEDCEFLLTRLCEWLNGDTFETPYEDMRIVYAIIKAVLAHLYIAWIHPFGDGNGRTARMLEFRILISSGVPHPAAHLLSNHYNQTRTEYYRQLKRASQSKGDIVPFIEYAAQGFLDGLREQVGMIQDQQWSVVWRDFVYRSFRGKSGEAAERRRAVAFALSDNLGLVPISSVSDLTRELFKAYFGKSRKTMTRDINILDEMGLVVKDKKHVRARFEAVSGFQAVTAES